MILSRTSVYESISTGFFVILTFDLVAGSDQVRVKFSVRSHTPQPVEAMLRVHAVWQSWVSRSVGGTHPALPNGWRYIDGAQEAATSGTPDHLH